LIRGDKTAAFPSPKSVIMQQNNNSTQPLTLVLADFLTTFLHS